MAEQFASVLELGTHTCDLAHRSTIVSSILHPKSEITIAMAGKYTALPESYHSVIEALIHAGAACDTRVKIYRLDTEVVEKHQDAQKYLEDLYDAGAFQAILVPG